jgi:adenylate cyclase
VPFVAQWSIGNFITASGISLWACWRRSAPCCSSAREALAWFFAYLFLTALSGFFDYLPGRQRADAGADQGADPDQRLLLRAQLRGGFDHRLPAAALLGDREAEGAGQPGRGHRLLQIEQDRSERLLLNILPGPIAERLKHSNQTIADGFADVTVMFVDIVNFTRVAEG